MTEIAYQIQKQISIYLTRDLLNTILFLLLFIILLRIYLNYLIKKQKTKTLLTGSRINKFLMEILKQIKFPLLLILIGYLISFSLKIEARLNTLLTLVFQSALTLQIIFLVQGAIKAFFESYAEEHEPQHPESRSLYTFISKFLIIVVWILGILLFLSNIGYDISSLITSIGVGGVAIALAVQNILKDIFSGFIILVNKPFKIGDFIKLDKDQKGTVEKIGFKNTSIKTISGEDLLIPNDDILNSRIYNFSNRDKRRVSFNLYLDTNTESQKISHLKTRISEIINNQKMTEKDNIRVTISEINQYSIITEVVYYMKNDNFNDFINTKDEINMQIKKFVEKENINFANSNPCVNINQ
ncbi:mechanosensitive ion channel [Candidatus Dojkabacteria bacterium]|nr:mechanosensitive ion channel [Candidatus Dojkabacteria bacterium]